MSLTKKLVLLLVVVALLAGVGVYVSGSGSSAGPSTSLSDSGTTANGLLDASVLLDGWSWASLKASQPAWYGANAGATSATSLNAKAITASQVTWLAANAPQDLAAVAGRMLSTSSNIVCATSGCTSSNASVPLSWFSDLSLASGYGSMYKGWGITAAIYVANIQVAPDQVSLSLTAKGWTTSTVSLSKGASPLSGAPADTAANGWGRNLYLYAAGLGQFFLPTPAWSSAKPQIWYPPVVLPNDALLTTNPAPPTPLYSHGLGTPTSGANLLNASELTYLTSPTTGCGFALCVPTTLGVHVSGYSTTTHSVCLRSDARARATLVVASSNWAVDFPFATHQETLANGGSSDIKKSGLPVFVSGNQKLRVETFSLYTGEALTSGFAVGGPLSPIEVAGSIYDARHTSATQLAATTPLSAIYTSWKTC